MTTIIVEYSLDPEIQALVAAGAKLLQSHLEQEQSTDDIDKAWSEDDRPTARCIYVGVIAGQ